MKLQNTVDFYIHTSKFKKTHTFEFKETPKCEKKTVVRMFYCDSLSNRNSLSGCLLWKWSFEIVAFTGARTLFVGIYATVSAIIYAVTEEHILLYDLTNGLKLLSRLTHMG